MMERQHHRNYIVVAARAVFNARDQFMASSFNTVRLITTALINQRK